MLPFRVFDGCDPPVEPPVELPFVGPAPFGSHALPPLLLLLLLLPSASRCRTKEETMREPRERSVRAGRDGRDGRDDGGGGAPPSAIFSVASSSTARERSSPRTNAAISAHSRLSIFTVRGKSCCGASALLPSAASRSCFTAKPRRSMPSTSVVSAPTSTTSASKRTCSS